MLAHSFDRFCVVVKFIFPTVDDLEFAALNFNKDSKYLRDANKNVIEEVKQHVSHLITYCRNIGSYAYFYKQQIKSHNETYHHILKNELNLILPQFPTRKEKRGIYTSLIPGFIELAYEGISSSFAQ